MRLRSLAVAAAITAALIGGMASPGQAATAPEKTAPVLTAPDATEGTLLAYGPGGGALYADGVLHASRPTPGSKLMHPYGTSDCGTFSCSYYFTRSETHKIHRNIALYGGGINGLAASCGLIALISGPASSVVAMVCGVSIAMYGQFFLNAVNHAHEDNKCLRIRWGTGVGGYAFYSDGGKFCKN